MTSLVKALHFTCCPSLQLVQIVQFVQFAFTFISPAFARIPASACLMRLMHSACAPCRHCHECPLNAWQVTTGTVLHIRRTSSTASALGQVLAKHCSFSSCECRRTQVGGWLLPESLVHDFPSSTLFLGALRWVRPFFLTWVVFSITHEYTSVCWIHSFTNMT